MHEAGATWFFSRWALGYHVSDDGEAAAAATRPSNPFRDPRPSEERFAPALANLATLERRHAGHDGVARFCRQVRADVVEICHPPPVVGVEIGAGYPFDWPFRRLHRPWPGGLPLEEILERLAYAAKLGAKSLYLLGGDVALRPERGTILEAAVARGAREIAFETTAIPLARPGAAALLREQGATSAVVEVLAGLGHPVRSREVEAGVAALRDAELRPGAKVVLGADERRALSDARKWLETLGLPLRSVVVLAPRAERWVREEVEDGVEVDVRRE
jgi:hypothetical protein